MRIRGLLGLVSLVAWLGGLAAAETPATETPANGILVREGFDQEPATGLAGALLAHRHVSLAKGAGPDGSDAIRVAYVGFDKGSERVVVRFPLGAKLEQATLSYDVCFEKDFKWVTGGKLHGLGPKRPITGGQPRKPEGWSARVNFKADGHCATYLYDQNVARTYGVGAGSPGPVFRAGQWHHVVLQVGLNTPGQADGFARIFVDGREQVHSRGMQFRGVGGEDTLIQNLLFSTFHGGSSPGNAPRDEQGRTITVHALFDNFVVREGLADPERGRGME